MKATGLNEATDWQNATAFGLTAGFHSLDEAEIDRWKENVQAGNLYINRGITGAIVQRQPFGGWKRSSIGPGAKAGGPNYVNLFRVLNDRNPEGKEDYRKVFREYFSKEHDPSGLRSESNQFRYRPCKGVLLRLAEPDPKVEALARAASETCAVPLMISRASEESDEELAQRLPELVDHIEFVRTTGESPGDLLLRKIARLDLNWINAPLVTNGRIELTRWMREQSVTETRHRYGNLIK